MNLPRGRRPFAEAHARAVLDVLIAHLLGRRPASSVRREASCQLVGTREDMEGVGELDAVARAERGEGVGDALSQLADGCYRASQRAEGAAEQERWMRHVLELYRAGKRLLARRAQLPYAEAEAARPALPPPPPPPARAAEEEEERAARARYTYRAR